MKSGGHKGGKKTISDEVAHSVESHGKKNASNSSLMKTVLSFYKLLYLSANMETFILATLRILKKILILKMKQEEFNLSSFLVMSAIVWFDACVK